MNRRGFLAAIAAIPAALLAGIRPALRWIPVKPVEYSIKPHLKYQREEIARIFRVPVSLINDAGDGGTFGTVEGTEEEIAEFVRQYFAKG